MALLPEEQQLMQMMEVERMEMDNALSQDAPDGDFSIQGLNTLVDALNSVLPMFEVEDYPEFDESIDGLLPLEFVRQLRMVMAAAAESGLDEYRFELSQMDDDQDLMMLAGRLEALAKDVGFKRFLKSSVPGAEPAEPSPEPAPIPAEVEPEVDAEAMMLSRV